MTPYSLNLLAGPDAEAVTLDEVLSQIQGFNSVPDDQMSYIEDILIPSARISVEKEIGRLLGLQTLELGLQYFPYMIEFPRPPLVSVHKITYKDFDEVTTVLFDDSPSSPVTCDLFAKDTSPEPGIVYLRQNKIWPFAVLSAGYPVRITYTAGLETIPVNLKHAVLLMAAHLYANREAVTEKQAYELPLAYKNLCEKSRYEEFR